MKFILFILPLTALHGSIYAQEYLGSAGRTDTSGNYSVSWNIGETNTSTQVKSNLTFTEGFEQPHFILTSLEKINNQNIEISVFPNPTSRGIHVKFAEEEMNDNFILRITDSQGREVKTYKLNQIENYLDLSQLTSASYFITISNLNNSYFEKFTLIKSH